MDDSTNLLSNCIHCKGNGLQNMKTHNVWELRSDHHQNIIYALHSYSCFLFELRVLSSTMLLKCTNMQHN